MISIMPLWFKHHSYSSAVFLNEWKRNVTGNNFNTDDEMKDSTLNVGKSNVNSFYDTRKLVSCYLQMLRDYI